MIANGSSPPPFSKKPFCEGPNTAWPRPRCEPSHPGMTNRRFFPLPGEDREALKTRLGDHGKTVLALGRMAANKGYDLLIRAMPPVFSRLPDAKLIVAVGAARPTDREQTQIEELKALARELRIRNKVVFRNHIASDELADCYRSADAFALSSRYEPFGMTAVEAMACGTPTVISTHGGLWEQVTWGTDALYADPLDPDAFGHAIHAILAYPQIGQKLSKAGAKSARENFTWTGVAERLLRTIEETSLEKRPPPDHVRAEA